MAVCIQNRKRDSLYPLTLQPAADHFRTQRCSTSGESVFSQSHCEPAGGKTSSLSTNHASFVHIFKKIKKEHPCRALPPSCDQKMSCMMEMKCCLCLSSPAATALGLENYEKTFSLSDVKSTEAHSRVYYPHLMLCLFSYSLHIQFSAFTCGYHTANQRPDSILTKTKL